MGHCHCTMDMRIQPMLLNPSAFQEGCFQSNICECVNVLGMRYAERYQDAMAVAALQDLIRRQRQRDYNSDSGVSEVGHSSGTMPRSMTKRRGDMRASSELYTESRPSMLSADRIAFTQHSGAAVAPPPPA